ncbi:hypothetical protein [Sphingomonas daechungensis]|uniref:hypothetical protein n=1 Tax=Sphingomonas daechungensis TaxID=1176646 RepID=UPI0037847A20
MATAPLRTPMHLWVVGVLSLLWNSFGAYDYSMTRMRNMDYLAGMSPPGVDPATMLAYIDGMPLYAQLGWGFGVWGALVGSIALLLRKRAAVWAFGVSIAGMILSFGYMFFGPPMPGSEAAGPMKYMPLIIVLLGLAQFAYARAAERKGLLSH